MAKEDFSMNVLTEMRTKKPVFVFSNFFCIFDSLLVLTEFCGWLRRSQQSLQSLRA